MHFPGGELVPSGGGDKIPLLRPHLIIGRSETCDICLKVSNVSSKHGELLCEDGLWYITDLDSTNGIKVNGLRIPTNVKKLLRPGDQMSIGQRQFILQYAAPEGLPDDEFRDLNPESVFKQSLLERAGLARSEPDADPVLKPAGGARRDTHAAPPLEPIQPLENTPPPPDSPPPSTT